MAPVWDEYSQIEYAVVSWCHTICAGVDRIVQLSSNLWSALTHAFRNLSGGVHAIVAVVVHIVVCWWQGLCAGFVWIIQLPHRFSSVLTHALQHLSDSVRSATAATIHTVKSVLWIVFVFYVLCVVLTIAIKIFPYLLHLFKILLESIYGRRERARSQRLLEKHKMEAEEEAKKEQEARRKKAFEEQEKVVQAQRQRLQEEQQLKRCFHDWQADAQIFFADVATARRFAEPQMDRCHDCEARSYLDDTICTLRICVHTLKKLLLVSGNDKVALRKQQHKWHPDRFHATAQSMRDEMISKATAMFQMLEGLHQSAND